MEDFLTTIAINYSEEISATATTEIVANTTETATKTLELVTNITQKANNTAEFYEYVNPFSFEATEETIIISLYSIISVLAFTGNTIVIFVEIFGRRSARNLRKFLINLATSDIIYGVLSVPFNFFSLSAYRWMFPHWLCKASQFAQTLANVVTMYTLTFIGIERYFATLHPLSRANRWLRSHCNLLLVMSWALGTSLSVYPALNTMLVSLKDANNETHYDCKHWQFQNDFYLIGNFLITFMLPLFLLTYSYGAIGRRLFKTQKNWKSFPQTSVSVSANAMSSSIANGNAKPGNEQSASLSSENAIVNPFGGLYNGNRRESHKTANRDRECANNNNACATNANAVNIIANLNGNKDSNHNGDARTRRRQKMSLTSNQSIDSSIAIPCINTTNKNNTTVKIYCNEQEASGKQPDAGSIVSNSAKFVPRLQRRNTEILHKMRVFRLLLAVWVFYIICWMPIKVYYIYMELCLVDKVTRDPVIKRKNLGIYRWSYLLAHMLAGSNSFINPIIYCFMSKSFRADLVDLFVLVLNKLNMRTKQSITQTPIPTMELKCRRGKHANGHNMINGRNNCYCLYRNNHRNGHTHQHFTFNRNIVPPMPLTVLPKEDNAIVDAEKEISQMELESFSDVISSKHESKSLPAHSFSHVSQSDSQSHKNSVFSC